MKAVLVHDRLESNLPMPQDKNPPKDPLLELFETDPLAHREFLDLHNEINTPWFRLRFLLALGFEHAKKWLGRLYFFGLANTTHQ